MRVFVESIFPYPPEGVWAKVQTSELLLNVSWPLIRVKAISQSPLPEHWTAPSTSQCKCYLFGVIPLGRHTIFCERIDPELREIQTRERELLVRRWDHLVRVRPEGDGHTRYSDEIEIEAGLLTPIVWLFAQVFYRHRQRRWKRLIRRWRSQAAGDGDNPPI